MAGQAKRYVVGVDAGGTSSDVALIKGAEPSVSNETEIEHAMPIHVPIVDVRTTNRLLDTLDMDDLRAAFEGQAAEGEALIGDDSVALQSIRRVHWRTLPARPRGGGRRCGAWLLERVALNPIDRDTL